MRAHSLIITAIVIAGSLLSADAEAACQANNLNGRWDVYALTPGFTEGWVFCALRVRNGGAVRNGSCVYSDERTRVTGGRVRVSPACRVSGYIIEDDGFETFRSRIVRSTMERRKDSFTGIARGSTGLRWLFVAVRR